MPPTTAPTDDVLSVLLQIRFLATCCAMLLAFLWGATTWRLILYAKGSRRLWVVASALGCGWCGVASADDATPGGYIWVQLYNNVKDLNVSAANNENAQALVQIKATDIPQPGNVDTSWVEPTVNNRNPLPPGTGQVGTVTKSVQIPMTVIDPPAFFAGTQPWFFTNWPDWSTPRPDPYWRSPLQAATHGGKTSTVAVKITWKCRMDQQDVQLTVPDGNGGTTTDIGHRRRWNSAQWDVEVTVEQWPEHKPAIAVGSEDTPGSGDVPYVFLSMGSVGGISMIGGFDCYWEDRYANISGTVDPMYPTWTPVGSVQYQLNNLLPASPPTTAPTTGPSPQPPPSDPPPPPPTTGPTPPPTTGPSPPSSQPSGGGNPPPPPPPAPPTTQPTTPSPPGPPSPPTPPNPPDDPGSPIPPQPLPPDHPIFPNPNPPTPGAPTSQPSGPTSQPTGPGGSPGGAGEGPNKTLNEVWDKVGTAIDRFKPSLPDVTSTELKISFPVPWLDGTQWFDIDFGVGVAKTARESIRSFCGLMITLMCVSKFFRDIRSY